MDKMQFYNIKGQITLLSWKHQVASHIKRLITLTGLNYRLFFINLIIIAAFWTKRYFFCFCLWMFLLFEWNLQSDVSMMKCFPFFFCPSAFQSHFQNIIKKKKVKNENDGSFCKQIFVLVYLKLPFQPQIIFCQQMFSLCHQYLWIESCVKGHCYVLNV